MQFGPLAVAGLLAGASLLARAEIYTCVDSKGRRLTADRPIPDCIDREQRQLSDGGIVVRKIGPSLTAEERAQEEERQRKALEERNRIAEEKKRDRALLTRYPDKSTHDKDRAEALATASEVKATATKHMADLLAQQKRQQQELEFYKSDPKKAPPALRRQMDETDQQIEAQKRFIANQDAEKDRINARFDEELVRLRTLWAQRAAPVTSAAASSPPKK